MLESVASVIEMFQKVAKKPEQMGFSGAEGRKNIVVSEELWVLLAAVKMASRAPERYWTRLYVSSQRVTQRKGGAVWCSLRYSRTAVMDLIFWKDFVTRLR